MIRSRALLLPSRWPVVTPDTIVCAKMHPSYNVLQFCSECDSLRRMAHLLDVSPLRPRGTGSAAALVAAVLIASVLSATVGGDFADARHARERAQQALDLLTSGSSESGDTATLASRSWTRCATSARRCDRRDERHRAINPTSPARARSSRVTAGSRFSRFSTTSRRRTCSAIQRGSPRVRDRRARGSRSPASGPSTRPAGVCAGRRAVPACRRDARSRSCSARSWRWR
jgi:hypothetical protein